MEREVSTEELLIIIAEKEAKAMELLEKELEITEGAFYTVSKQVVTSDFIHNITEKQKKNFEKITCDMETELAKLLFAEGKTVKLLCGDIFTILEQVLSKNILNPSVQALQKAENLHYAQIYMRGILTRLVPELMAMDAELQELKKEAFGRLALQGM